MTTSKANWTILVYIAAHNNLDVEGQRSLAQLQQAGRESGIQLVALLDGWQGASRHVIAPVDGTPLADETPLIEFLGRYDSGDPRTLLETATWAYQHYPAEHYGLVLWSHGSGYWNDQEFKAITEKVRGPAASLTERDVSAADTSLALFRTTLEKILSVQSPAERAILFDDGTQHSLDTLQLGDILSTLHQSLGQPLDLLGMDACLMGNLEVAYQVRQDVKCYVGSEELVPGTSWPYDVILQHLQANPQMTGVELGQTIVADYAAFYTTHPPMAGDVTKIALDLAQIEQVTQPLKALAVALQAQMPAYAKVLWQSQRHCCDIETRRGRRKSSKFKYFLWDLATLAVSLSRSADPAVCASAEAVVQALRSNTFVVAEAHQGDWFDGIGGLSIYMAPTDREIAVSTQYANLALAQDVGWSDLLNQYKQC